MYTRTDAKRRLAVAVLLCAFVTAGCSDDMMGPETAVELRAPSQAITTQEARSRETLPAPSFAVAAIDDAIGRILPALGHGRSTLALGSELEALRLSIRQSGGASPVALDRAMARVQQVADEESGAVSAADLDVIRLALGAARSWMAEDRT